MPLFVVVGNIHVLLDLVRVPHADAGARACDCAVRPVRLVPAFI